MLAKLALSAQMSCKGYPTFSLEASKHVLKSCVFVLHSHVSNETGTLASVDKTAPVSRTGGGHDSAEEN